MWPRTSAARTRPACDRPVPAQEGPGVRRSLRRGSSEKRERDGWLSIGVSGVGLTSFFSDAGHEITTALLPAFVTSILRGTAAALGLIEGVSDALMGIAKLFAGPAANDAALRRRMASSGYLGTAVATGAIGLAATVWQAGVLRAIAWMARGARSPARDALLAGLADDKTFGRAYGLERAGDNLGAVAGPLLAAGLVGWVGVRHAMLFAFVPGVCAAVAITLVARHAGGTVGAAKARVRGQLSAMVGTGAMRTLLPITLFEFGNVATTLLILRATQLLHVGGRGEAAAASLAILLYAGHNVVAALVALGGGHWVDRSSARTVFGAGAVVYVAGYACFALGPHQWWAILIAFSLAGSGIGLAETAESAFLAQLLPDRLRGSGFGMLGAIQAAGDLVSTVVVGVLFTTVSYTAGFIYAAAWMVLAAGAAYGTALLG